MITPVRSRAALALGLLLFASATCGRKEREKPKHQASAAVHCASDQDCDDENPCTREECHAGDCAVLPAEQGKNCDDGNVCDGVASCDGRGQCLKGPAPTVDDGNACTSDACDPVRGVSHQAVAVDDSDECTQDACDPRTGQVSHDAVKIDDGDDCSFDSCDPKRGVSHRRPDAFHTCASSCGEGFHAASKRPSKDCGSEEALQTFCAPSCGKSFYTCDSGCPPGYDKGQVTTTDVCGSRTSQSTFCAKSR